MASQSTSLMRVEVTVSGAVCSMGKYSLHAPAHLSDALAAAGGVLHKDSMRPSGQITVRRPSPTKKVEVWRFNLDETSAANELELKQGDLVVVLWDVDMKYDQSLESKN